MREEKKPNGRHRSDNKIGIVGAKKKADSKKKKPVTVYVVKEHIDSIGGIVEARNVARNAVMKAKKVKSLKK